MKQLIKLIKGFLKKNKKLHKLAVFIYDCYVDFLLWKRLDAKEKSLRKKYNISTNQRKSLVDSKFFWLIFNMTELIKGRYDFTSNSINDSRWLIIDAGASNGFYSTLIQKFLNDVEFILIEPQKKYYDELKELGEKFQIYNCLLGDYNGHHEFYENRIAEGLTSISKINKKYNYLNKNINYHNYLKKESKIYRLDSIVDTNKNILLKCDTQGSELKILKGSEKLFRNAQIKIVHLELMTIEKYENQDNYLEIFNFLNERSFIIFDIMNTNKEINTNYSLDRFDRMGQLTEFEVVFIHKSLTTVSY